jgi:hypothetical protein
VLVACWWPVLALALRDRSTMRVEDEGFAVGSVVVAARPAWAVAWS